MRTPPTPEELRAAWEAMRHRRALQHWPQDFGQVLADPLRCRCIALEATAARHDQKPTVFGIDHASGPDQTSYWRPPTRTSQPAPIDRKRAAAGDLDDD